MRKISLAFAVGLGIGALAGCDDPRKTQIAWDEYANPHSPRCGDDYLLLHFGHKTVEEVCVPYKTPLPK